MANLTVRYWLQRMTYAFEVAYKAASVPHISFLDAYSQAYIQARKALNERLTEVIYFAGASMTPTLNPKVTKDRDAVDRLLVRIIPIPSVRNLHVFDVVAFHSPYKFGDNHTILVRRIAALPGDQMISDSLQLEPFLIPPEHCWVLADNTDMEPSDVVDSRFFGPLPLQSIRGRVIYNGHNHQDHGRVINNSISRLSDEAILKYELNLNKFFN